MTRLTIETAGSVALYSDGDRYVRDGDEIAFQPSEGVDISELIHTDHAMFAEKENLGKPIRTSTGHRRRLSDAGFVSRDEVTGKLTFMKNSVSCELDRDPRRAREETYRVAREKGLPV